jgi:hypothetical protein
LFVRREKGLQRFSEFGMIFDPLLPIGLITLFFSQQVLRKHLTELHRVIGGMRVR